MKTVNKTYQHLRDNYLKSEKHADAYFAYMRHLSAYRSAIRAVQKRHPGLTWREAAARLVNPAFEPFKTLESLDV